MSSPKRLKMEDINDEEIDLPMRSSTELAADRERRDKISKMMGDHLLKGYKMLDRTCDACDCILLQAPRNGPLLCIACDEIDKVTKPIPNNSQPAAAKREIAGSIPESNGLLGQFDTVKRNARLALIDRITFAANLIETDRETRNNVEKSIEAVRLIEASLSALDVLARSNLS